MRNNQPVNNTEHRMKPDDVLVSKTDLKGKITYANEDFCKIAGMSAEELIGQPHNVVRHPDMPAAAFNDLWQTLKAGKPWAGFVKNRSADGGFYWVYASVSPEFDQNGHVSGYISVRTCPSQDQLNAIDSVYKDVNAGKTKLQSTLKFSLRNRFKIKTKLITVALLSSITLLSLLWISYSSISDTIVKDEMHIKALDYVIAIRQVMEDLPRHRGLSNAYLNGDTTVSAGLRIQQQNIDKDFAELLKVGRMHEHKIPLSEQIKEINRRWTNLANNWKQLTTQENFNEHTSLINDLLALSMHTGVITGFLSASSIVESMAARVLVIQGLELVEHMGQLRGLGTGLAAKGEASEGEKERLIELNGSVRLLLEEVISSLKEAIDASQIEAQNDHQVNYEKALQTMERDGHVFSKLAKRELVKKSDIEIPSKDYFEAGSKAIASTLALFDEVAKETESHLAFTVEQDISQRLFLVAITGSIVLFIIALLIYTTFMIAEPLEVITKVLKKVVANDYSMMIKKKQDNELGDVLDLITIMQSRLQFEVFESKKSIERQQKLDKKRQEKNHQEGQVLADTFESEIGSLVTGLNENALTIHDSMEKLSATADKLNNQSNGAQTSVSQSTDYVGTTAAAIEEMSISVASVVEQISETLEISKQAVHEAESSSNIMKELVSASAEIGSVVSTINDIAEQTNLLALNASIEAARAGDAGRGFAVVAGEVKELANQTSQATGQIREQVEHIQSQSKKAGCSIEKIQGIIEKVSLHSGHVASAMDEQNEATREMSSGAQYANSSMQEAKNSVSEVSIAAASVDQSAEDNLNLADGMLEKIEVVQQQVQSFVERLKH